MKDQHYNYYKALHKLQGNFYSTITHQFQIAVKLHPLDKGKDICSIQIITVKIPLISTQEAQLI